MRLSPDFLAELRERVPLSSIVGRAVTWDRNKTQAGRGDYWACCPFHQEKTPSFHVDDRKGYYHCFGCHASGDHLAFLMEHDGLPFLEAAEKLADAAGVALPQEGRPEPRAVRERASLRTALEAAAAFYARTLKGPDGRDAREYAQGRGITRDALATFAFGLAPSAPGALLSHLKAEGIGADIAQKAGLAAQRDGGGHRDRFRGRLMVPIHDARGAIVGFGGRTLEGRDPKYLNSPQTALFDKSTLLFNAHRARGPAHRAGRLVLVEGYMDAIALAVHGIGEVVASLGTALTDEQIQKAWTLADEPTLCFDGDAAGRAAAHRAIDRIVPALTVGRSFQFMALPNGQDPDDFLRAEGREAFEARLAAATPLVDAVFEREVERGTDTPERMAALEARLEALAASIKEERVGRLYREAFRQRCFELRRTATRPQAPPKRGSGTPARAARMVPPPATADRALLDLERILLGLLIYRPRFIENFGDALSDAVFVNEAHAAFAGMLLEAHACDLPEDAAELLAILPQRARLLVSELWGAADEAPGRRLLERFSILECEPDDRFLERCMTLFLDRLALRAELAELHEEPRRMEAGAAGETRLLSLSAAIAAHRTKLQDEERNLADEAAALRRRKPPPAPA